VRTLGALEARFADDHVPLALVVGALGALSAVRRLLPEKATSGAPPSSTVPLEQGEGSGSMPEPFVALLLGVIVTRERLLEMLGPIQARDNDLGRVASDEGDAPRLEGLLR
jgi:hypothetical protein